MNIETTLLTSGILATGLMSGLLYGWTVSVIPGLRRIPDPSYLSAMQHINRAIVNPAFVIPFMAIPIVLGAAAIAQFRAGDQRRGWLLACATATYVMGVLGVTFGRNIPLNNALETFNLPASSELVINERRHTYESPWNRWHYLRTTAGIASFALTAAAALIAAQPE